ncbi:hypothetical protein BAE44_0011307 [Dichanthelium oligosanthes]|uniref:VQ domain-containing protein n=1 Tax=Dichanthelium oligosanthes TaxID=888268 RepID=A0A1E5VRG3_9POAL|nr:hypothetical protein BAE44_0011307 [Dichanthelium oligosanthes]
MKHAAKLPSRGAASSSPAVSAHSIAKVLQRKIRIIHVLEPEVIKTEARQFRELVQMLTGKPVPNGSDVATSAEDALSSSCDDGPGAVAAIELKVEEEAETSSSGEGGGFQRAHELDGCNDRSMKLGKLGIFGKHLDISLYS